MVVPDPFMPTTNMGSVFVMRHIPVCDLPHILSSYLRPVDVQANLLNSRENIVSEGFMSSLLLLSKAINWSA